MKIIEINRVRLPIKGKATTIEVESLFVDNGEIGIIPVNKKYQYYRILLKNCELIKYKLVDQTK